jgi:hypothetical protein
MVLLPGRGTGKRGPWGLMAGKRAAGVCPGWRRAQIAASRGLAPGAGRNSDLLAGAPGALWLRCCNKVSRASWAL